MKKWLPVCILGAIFVFALFLRVVDLSHIPNGLHQDELNAGYQGYKIIHTGKDLQGNFLPLYVNRFGDYRPGGIFYVDGLFTSLVGLNTFSIRFPAAFIGSLTIFPVFFLTFLISKKKGIGYLAAFFMAISPWHIVASRATSEQVIALFLIITGVFVLLKGLEEKKISWFVYSGISLLLSYFFYHTPRVFIPAFLTLFLVFFIFHPIFTHFRKIFIAKRLVLIIWLVLCGTTIVLTFTKFGIGRFNQTSIFSSPDTINKIKTLSDTDKNILSARIFHNKAVVYTKVFLDQYLTYFSIDFLFVRGGLPDRYVIPDMGLFYYSELPFMLLGFYFLLKKKDIFFVIPLLWLLCGPLAAAVTTEDVPNIERAIFMLPAFQIIEAYGLYYVWDRLGKKKRWLFGTAIGLCLAVNMIYFFHQYIVHSPSYVAYRRDDGTEELFANLTGKEKDYKAIYLSSYQDLPLYYYYLHMGQTPLAGYKQQNVDKGFQVGKYIFIPDECPERIVPVTQLKDQKSLIVDFGNCSNQSDNLHLIDTVYRRDGTTAYILKAVN